MDLGALGRWLIVTGLALAVLGVILLLAGKGFWPRLPGDLSFTVGKVRVFLPLASSLLISILLTLVLMLIARK